MDTATITAPQTAFRKLPIKLLRPSKTKIQAIRRAHFDQDKIGELAESIKQQGLLQPILVRPAPRSPALNYLDTDPTHEIVAGERRFLAAQKAGLTDIDCHCRELTDDQVLEAQLVENLQREDVSPLEEAEGYRELLTMKNIKAEDLGALIGKSRAYVYARMKLLDLCPDARKLLDTGGIDASVALLIARIPDAKMQAKAAKGCADLNDIDGDLEFYVDRQSGPLTHDEAKEFIDEAFMVRIDGNKKIEEARKAGKKVFAGADAEPLIEHGSLKNHVDLSDDFWAGEKKKLFRDIIGAPAETVVVQMPDGRAVEAVPKDVARRIFAEKKIELPYELKPRESGRITADMPVTDKEKIKREQRKKRLAIDIRRAQFKAVRAKYPAKLGKPELLELIPNITWCFGKPPETIAPIPKAFDKLNEKELVGVLLDLMLGGRIDDDYRWEETYKRTLAACKRYGVNADKIKTDLTATFNAGEALRGKPATTKPAKKKAAKK